MVETFIFKLMLSCFFHLSNVISALDSFLFSILSCSSWSTQLGTDECLEGCSTAFLDL